MNDISSTPKYCWNVICAKIVSPYNSFSMQAAVLPITIRDRLIEKYVQNGEWDCMDDDERQDAVLLEKMLWLEEQPDRKVYSVEESNQILADLKAECYAD